jgi:pimeloyl-ACP methyl ester carboxylesterase
MGCQVALALARRSPQRVGGLGLVGPTDGADLAPLWRNAAGMLLDVLAEKMLYNGMLFRMYFQMGIPRYLATVRRMAEDDPAERARAVRAPCLIVRGGHDGIVPEQAARRLAHLLPRGSFLPVEGTAHALQFNAPDRFTQIALAFWSRAEAEAGNHSGGPLSSEGGGPLLDALRAVPLASFPG